MLNFAPAVLVVPEGVVVRKVDLSTERRSSPSTAGDSPCGGGAVGLVVLGCPTTAPRSPSRVGRAPTEERAALEEAVVRSSTSPRRVVLSTCNRTEVYAECLTFHGALADITAALAEACSVDKSDPAPPLRPTRTAASPIFAVASGLDSMAVGEAQILGQVRRALARAQRHGHVGPALNAVLQQALRVAKRVHTETGIDLVSGSSCRRG